MRHMKKHSRPLAVSEMQIKTTKKYHFLLSNWQSLKWLILRCKSKDAEEWVLSHTDANIMKHFCKGKWGVLMKIKNAYLLLFSPVLLLGIYLKGALMFGVDSISLTLSGPKSVLRHTMVGCICLCLLPVLLGNPSSDQTLIPDFGESLWHSLWFPCHWPPFQICSGSCPGLGFCSWYAWLVM